MTNSGTPAAAPAQTTYQVRYRLVTEPAYTRHITTVTLTDGAEGRAFDLAAAQIAPRIPAAPLDVVVHTMSVTQPDYPYPPYV